MCSRLINISGFIILLVTYLFFNKTIVNKTRPAWFMYVCVNGGVSQITVFAAHFVNVTWLVRQIQILENKLCQNLIEISWLDIELE